MRGGRAHRAHTRSYTSHRDFEVSWRLIPVAYLTTPHCFLSSKRGGFDLQSPPRGRATKTWVQYLIAYSPHCTLKPTKNFALLSQSAGSKFCMVDISIVHCKKSSTKGEFTQYPFFVRFCFSLTKYPLFHPHFYVSISALTRQSHTGQKFSEKNFFKGVQLYFEISLLSFIQKIFEQNLYLYITVYLVRIWTYKNAEWKSAYFFKEKQKRKKNRRKHNEKRILCKFT